jgi:hypothetical protein
MTGPCSNSSSSSSSKADSSKVNTVKGCGLLRCQRLNTRQARDVQRQAPAATQRVPATKSVQHGVQPLPLLSAPLLSAPLLSAPRQAKYVARQTPAAIQRVHVTQSACTGNTARSSASLAVDCSAPSKPKMSKDRPLQQHSACRSLRQHQHCTAHRSPPRLSMLLHQVSHSVERQTPAPPHRKEARQLCNRAWLASLLRSIASIHRHNLLVQHLTAISCWVSPVQVYCEHNGRRRGGARGTLINTHTPSWY